MKDFRWWVGGCMAAVLVLSVAAFSGAASDTWVLKGPIAHVVDGDTTDVLVDKSPIRIRLEGIDCPERGQPYGQAAKDYLKQLDGRSVEVVVSGKDRYGRFIGTLWAQGENVNLSLVRSGLAWWYRKYAPNREDLRLAGEQARNERRGLWRDVNPEPPWSWRHK